MNHTPDRDAIRQSIQDRYGQVAKSARGEFNYPTGKEGALALGYPEDWIDSMPSSILQTFCGVGNPLSLAKLAEGMSVLDVGCGGGLDLFRARNLVGKTGSVFGIDLTKEMVEKAKTNIQSLGYSNVQVSQGQMESLSFEDNRFDVVISNGVFNLSPDKIQTFSEVSRVLKSQGKLLFADMVLKEKLPEEFSSSLKAWSD